MNLASLAPRDRNPGAETAACISWAIRRRIVQRQRISRGLRRDPGRGPHVTPRRTELDHDTVSIDHGMGLVEGLGRAKERLLERRLLLFGVAASFRVHAGECVEDDGRGRGAVVGFHAIDVQRVGRESGMDGPVVAQDLCLTHV